MPNQGLICRPSISKQVYNIGMPVCMLNYNTYHTLR